MRHDAFHQPLRQTLSSMFGNHEHIGEVRERREVRNHSCKTDLRSLTEQSEAQRISQRFFNCSARDAVRPIRIAQKTVDYIQIELMAIGGDAKFVFAPLRIGRGLHVGIAHAICARQPRRALPRNCELPRRLPRRRKAGIPDPAGIFQARRGIAGRCSSGSHAP